MTKEQVYVTMTMTKEQVYITITKERYESLLETEAEYIDMIEHTN